MEMLTTKQAADLIGFSEGTVENWRMENKGPPYYKVQGKIFYNRDEILSWMLSNKVEPEGDK